MNIAFYAPLKPPTHPTPSGDRRMARLLIQAWQQAGHHVDLASSFRSYDQGDENRQRRLKALGEHLADRLIRRYRARPMTERPDAWFTYHLYHKAPDWIGPRVANALSIPYLVAEASYAPKQAHGKWATGHAATQTAIYQADLILGFNPTDAACLAPLLRPGTQHLNLPPIINTEPYGHNQEASRSRLAKHYNLDQKIPWLLTVAMMRDDQKRKSYDILARALEKIKDRSWHLLITGNGPAEAAIKAQFAPLKERVTWLGFQDEKALTELYAASDLFLWPAIKEAYGMVFLEALSSNLPVVAGHSPGVASIVRHDQTGLLTPQGDEDAFAKAVARLLDLPDLRLDMSTQARASMIQSHGLDSMATFLDTQLKRILMRAAA